MGQECVLCYRREDMKGIRRKPGAFLCDGGEQPGVHSFHGFFLATKAVQLGLDRTTPRVFMCFYPRKLAEMWTVPEVRFPGSAL